MLVDQTMPIRRYPLGVDRPATELDIQRADADQLSADFPDYVGDGTVYAWTERQEEYEHFRAVDECCRGTDPNCAGHFRYYTGLDDRFTYRED